MSMVRIFRALGLGLAVPKVRKEQQQIKKRGEGIHHSSPPSWRKQCELLPSKPAVAVVTKVAKIISSWCA